jgi:hypothetical protein
VSEFIGSMVQAGTNCSVGIIHPAAIPRLWKRVRPHIEKCVPHSEGELRVEDFYDALISADMQLWVALEDNDILASMVTQVIPYPTKQVLRIIAIGGEAMGKWFHFLADIEEFALALNCTSLEAWGRKGWKKILTDWDDSYVVYTKEIDRRLH